MKCAEVNKTHLFALHTTGQCSTNNTTLMRIQSNKLQWRPMQVTERRAGGTGSFRKEARFECKCTVASLGHESTRRLSWNCGLRNKGKGYGHIHAREGTATGVVGPRHPLPLLLIYSGQLVNQENMHLRELQSQEQFCIVLQRGGVLVDWSQSGDLGPGYLEITFPLASAL